MAIRFPRMHIAESALNRILNLRDELAEETPPPAAPAAPVAAPTAPDPALQGIELDAALAAPTPPVDAPAEPDPLVGTVARGTDLVDAL